MAETEKNRNRIVIAALAAAAAVLLASAILLRGTERDALRPAVLLADAILLMLILICAMAAALRASLRKTLYSYTNIGLIGGLLYCTVLAAAVFPYFIFGMREGGLTLSEILRAVIAFPRKFSNFATLVISAVSLLVIVSNIALIRHEGFHLGNALGLLLAFFYIGGTAAAYVVSDLLAERVLIPRGISADPVFLALHTAIPLFVLLVLCYLECIFVGCCIMGWLAARQKPSYDKDYIIILGCSINKRGGLLPLLRGRVNRAIRFAWEQEIATGKPLYYVPSGGQGSDEIMSEGSAMELYLLSHGAESYEVFPEKKSASTWENMCFSKAVIDGLKPDAKVAFATTNYHMLRSGILARMAGIDAEGIAGDTKWYFWPNGFVREFFAILTLNLRAHRTFAVITAVLCALIGIMINRV